MARRIRTGSPTSGTAIRRRTGRLRERTGDVKVYPYDEGEIIVPTINGPEISPFRGGEYLHVSDLIYKCIRKIALSHKFSAPMPDEQIFPSQAVTFALGHAIGDYVIERVKKRRPSELYGKFLCACEGYEVEGVYSRIQRSKKVCNTCAKKPEKYKEITLKNDDLMLVGNVDIVYFHDDVYVLGELKSIAGNLWEELTGPKPEHVIQILMYWWMARAAGWTVQDKVSILYVNKAFTFAKSPYKEYVLQPSLMLNRLDDYIEDARGYAEYRRTGTWPARVHCGTANDPKAKKCHMSTECFAL